MAKPKPHHGRPFTFDEEMRQALATLVLRYGATKAKELSPVSVSVSTLLKIAREFDIRLRKGRKRLEPETRESLADLICRHGVKKAQELSPVYLSLNALRDIAREFGISLLKGRGRKSPDEKLS